MAETLLYSFLGGADGNQPSAGVVLDLDERSGEPRGIYGTTTSGGYFGPPWCGRLGGCGTLFKIAGGTKTTLLRFGLDVVGNFPMGNPLALEGNPHRPFTILGTASDAFLVGSGRVYRYSAGHPQVLADVADWPLAGLTRGPGGTFYGTGSGLTLNPGTVFSMTNAPNTLNTIFHFEVRGTGGCGPQTALLFDHGALYGTTASVNTLCPPQKARVFKLNPPAAGQTEWSLQTIWTLPGTDNPSSGLIAGWDGALYGEAANYVYKLTPPAWTEETVWTFDGGDQPSGNLLLDRNGDLYGTTSSASACGSVFKLAATHGAWALDTLWNFTGADGCGPGGIVSDRHGTLYGATASGGSAGHGAVFEVTGTGFLPPGWTIP